MNFRPGRREWMRWTANAMILGALSICALSATAAGCSDAGLQCKAVVPATTCMNGETLQICADVSSNVCYFQMGNNVRAATCSSCNEYTVDADCMSSAAAYCGSGSGSGSGSSSGGIGTGEPCGSACAYGTTCSYAASEDVSCEVSCAAGAISSASASFGTNCTPEDCSGAVSSCTGSTACSALLSNANCGADPCVGTVKSGIVTITCSGGTSSGSSGSSSGGVDSYPACNFLWSSQTCASCVTGSCCGYWQTCAGDSYCNALVNCAHACAGNTACVTSCENQYSSASSEYQTAISCDDTYCSNSACN
jgi:hypothetical protein